MPPGHRSADRCGGRRRSLLSLSSSHGAYSARDGAASSTPGSWTSAKVTAETANNGANFPTSVIMPEVYQRAMKVGFARSSCSYLASRLSGPLNPIFVAPPFGRWRFVTPLSRGWPCHPNKAAHKTRVSQSDTVATVSALGRRTDVIRGRAKWLSACRYGGRNDYSDHEE